MWRGCKHEGHYLTSNHQLIQEQHPPLADVCIFPYSLTLTGLAFFRTSPIDSIFSIPYPFIGCSASQSHLVSTQRTVQLRPSRIHFYSWLTIDAQRHCSGTNIRYRQREQQRE
jgi:hypothetical protein